MFTGIIQKRGRLHRLEERQGGRRLWLELEPWAKAYEDGESIAVNGVCLTLAGRDGDRIAFDVLEETLRKTSLGSLQEGTSVNLERALCYGDAMGGHIVQGHVDGCGQIRSIREAGPDRRIEIQVPEVLRSALIPQGSICCDGISLTVAEIVEDGFAVHLIPTTLRDTSWGESSVGDPVNLEEDVLLKVIRKDLAEGRLRPDWDWSSFSSLKQESSDGV